MTVMRKRRCRKRLLVLYELFDMRVIGVIPAP